MTFQVVVAFREALEDPDVTIRESPRPSVDRWISIVA